MTVASAEAAGQAYSAEGSKELDRTSTRAADSLSRDQHAREVVFESEEMPVTQVVGTFIE